MKTIFQKIAFLAFLNFHIYASDWTKEFELVNGSKMMRSAESIIIRTPDSSESHHTELQIEACSTYQGITPNSLLYLDMSLSEESFISALIDSGLYVGTETEMEHYQNIAKWTEKFQLNHCTIYHYPERITLHIRATGKSSSSKNRIIKKILLKTHSTREEFTANIERLKNMDL